MKLVKLYENIDLSNEHTTFKLSNNFYKSIRDYLLTNYTIIVEDENKELIDDNV